MPKWSLCSCFRLGLYCSLASTFSLWTEDGALLPHRITSNTHMILKPFIKQHWHIYCGFIMRLMQSIMWLTLYCNMKIMHNLSMGIFGSAHIFPFILLIHHLYSKQLPMTLHHGSFWKLVEACFNPLHLWCGAGRQKQSNNLKSNIVFGDQTDMNYSIIIFWCIHLMLLITFF